MPCRLAVFALSIVCTLLPRAATGQEIPPEQPEPIANHTPADESRAAIEPGIMRRLLRTAARDFKQIPAPESRTILLNAGMLALAAYPVDDLATLGASSSPLLKSTFGTTGKLLGEEWVQGGSALAAYLAGRMFNRPQLRQVGADLVEAQLFSATLTQPLKLAVRRTRPDGEARSFPSGHASASFATATVLHRHFGRRAAVPAYAAALYITMSRLQANSHYASDVIVGAALGMVAGRAATIDTARARLQITPAAVKGGAAVLITPLPFGSRLTGPTQ